MCNIKKNTPKFKINNLFFFVQKCIVYFRLHLAIHTSFQTVCDKYFLVKLKSFFSNTHCVSDIRTEHPPPPCMQSKQ